jgi:hypothetical protein
MQKKLIQHQQLYHDFQAASSLKCQAIIAGHCCLEIARTKKRCENLDGCKAGMVETRATSEPCKHPIAVLSNAVYSPAKDQKIRPRKCLMSTKQPQLLDTVGEQILDL